MKVTKILTTLFLSLLGPTLLLNASTIKQQYDTYQVNHATSTIKNKLFSNASNQLGEEQDPTLGSGESSSVNNATFFPIQKELNMYLWYGILPSAYAIAQVIDKYDSKFSTPDSFVSTIVSDIANYSPNFGPDSGFTPKDTTNGSDGWPTQNNTSFLVNYNSTATQNLPPSPYNITQTNYFNGEPADLDVDNSVAYHKTNKTQTRPNSQFTDYLLNFKTTSPDWDTINPSVFASTNMKFNFDKTDPTKDSFSIDPNLYKANLTFNLYLITDYYFNALTKEVSSAASLTSTDSKSQPLKNYFSQLFDNLAFSGAIWMPNPEWNRDWNDSKQITTLPAQGSWQKEIESTNFQTSPSWVKNHLLPSYLSLYQYIPVTPSVASFVWTSVNWEYSKNNDLKTSIYPGKKDDGTAAGAQYLRDVPNAPSSPTKTNINYFTNVTMDPKSATPVGYFYIQPWDNGINGSTKNISNIAISIDGKTNPKYGLIWQTINNKPTNVPNGPDGTTFQDWNLIYDTKWTEGSAQTPPSTTLTKINTYFDTSNAATSFLKPFTDSNTNIFNFLFFQIYLGYQLGGNTVPNWIAGSQHYSKVALSGSAGTLLAQLSQRYMSQNFVTPNSRNPELNSPNNPVMDPTKQTYDQQKVTTASYYTFFTNYFNNLPATINPDDPTPAFSSITNNLFQNFSQFSWNIISNELWGKTQPDKTKDDPSYKFNNNDGSWKNNFLIKLVNKATETTQQASLKVIADDMWNYKDVLFDDSGNVLNPNDTSKFPGGVDPQGRSYQGNVMQYLNTVLNDISTYNALKDSQSYIFYIVISIIAAVGILIFLYYSVTSIIRIKEYSKFNKLKY